MPTQSKGAARPDTQALAADLDRLRDQRLYRSLERVGGRSASHILLGQKKLLNFGSNDYLGLSVHPVVKKAAAAAVLKWGAGSGASRLLAGNLAVHEDLEKRLAAFKREEACTVYSSGYLANLGAVTALVSAGDVVLVDRLNHASLIDAARLSGAKLWVYAHRDVAELAALLGRAGSFKRRLVLTDSYFSMDGTVAPLHDILDVCRRHGALLMIDEAHATGVFGKTGRGLTEHFRLSGQIDVVMGTLSKALGSVGGYIAGSRCLKEYLVNRSRELIYTTAPAPAASAAAASALGVIQKHPEILAEYRKTVAYAREKIESEGFDLMNSEGPILPIRVGDAARALAWRESLKKAGFYVPAVRPPSVPKGTERLRVTLTAAHTRRDVDALTAALVKSRKR